MHHSRLCSLIIDCQADDLADAARFWSQALGARRVKAIRTWVVMEAPACQRFCVVRPQRAGPGPHANRWDT